MIRLLTFVAVLVVVGVVNGRFVDEEEVDKAWEDFKTTYNRQYENLAETSNRRAIFAKKYRWIQKHNEEYNLGIHTYYVGVNKFTDWTDQEWKNHVSCFSKPGNFSEDAPIFEGTDERTPSKVDWRKKGAVTPVKDQLSCGSCWSFSATGAMEGAYKIKKRVLKSFSEQQLVDCDKNSDGCAGGYMKGAFNYVKKAGGIELENDYPYTHLDGYCRFNKKKIAASFTGYVSVKSGSEKALTQAAAKQPISVAIDARHSSFSAYQGGVYSERHCSSTDLHHGVLVVGYGKMKVHGGKKPYYIVKNSWGPTWGHNGYILMSRNNNNNCGIATQASYPTV